MFRLIINALVIAISIGCALCANADEVTDAVAKIDGFIAEGWSERGVVPGDRCSDEVFVRRVYLDVAGRIPTIAERRSFMEDVQPGKRAVLIQQLCSSEDYALHFSDTFDSLLMGRGSADKYRQRNSSQWKAWLARVFRENRPWNSVVAEILLARPDSPDNRGVVWFLYERNDKHQDIAEAVAPAFFGIRIECAQCHDHMVATEIEQRHYWGLVAFFNRSKNTKTKNGPRVSESAIGGFSEFADLSGDSNPNLLTFFEAKTVEELRPPKDEKQEEKDDLYVAAALEGDPRVPKFSRREQFVKEIAANHPLIARAFVNRIWAMLIGRGIVHPFDEMDSTHPPSHPELLNFLAEDFHDSGYDIRRLVRIVLHSRAYQLSSRRQDGHDDPASFAWYLDRPLTAEQFVRSAQVALQTQFRNDHPLIEKVRARLKDVMPEENVTRIGDALFLTNNEALNAFISDSNGENHLPTLLLKTASNKDRINQAVEHIFGRRPTGDEVEAAEHYLAVAKDRQETRIHHLIWSLLTSAEFRFNH